MKYIEFFLWQFEGNEMQDAHEFLITLCDSFESETLEFKKQTPAHDESAQKQNSGESDTNQKQNVLSPIEKNFGFKVQETKVCDICQHVSLSQINC